MESVKNMLYHYKGKVVRVIDHDTFVADLDLGFDTYRHNVHIQLSEGIELNDEQQYRLPGRDVLIRSSQVDGFGRVVASKLELL